MTLSERQRPPTTDVAIDGHRVRLSNLDKVLWPQVGLTKRWLLDYYVRVAPVLLPHLREHPVTLHRFPDGVEATHWYETRAPAHPEWVETVTFRMQRTGKVFDVCVINDLASLVWAAQIAAVELHPYLGTVDALERPGAAVFDLDPGPPASMIDCCRVALDIREELANRSLAAYPKTSGGAGLHLYVPLDRGADYGRSKAFVKSVALALEQDHPGSVTASMRKAARAGKVFVDWSQNDAGKSTVSVYSLRGWPVPTVSTPVSWEEVEQAAGASDASSLTFLPADVIRRVDQQGDLFAPVRLHRQSLS